MTLYDWLLQREVVIALAIVGALIATVGSFLLKRESTIDPRLAKIAVNMGYGITFASIALFIIAGFRAGP